MIEVVVGGAWLSSVSFWGDLEYSTRADGGCGVASWAMPTLAPNFNHAALRRGAPVVLSEGGVPLWRGVLSEPDRVEWRFHASGLADEADRFPAIDADDRATSNASVAIRRAIELGLPWTYEEAAEINFPYTTSGATASLNTLRQLLDAVTASIGMRWGVDEYGRFFVRRDPVEPSFMVDPGVAQMGVADDEYRSHLIGLRVSDLGIDGAPSAYATLTLADAVAAERWGTRYEMVDLTPLGLISAAQAHAILSEMRDQSGARMAWTNGITALDTEVRTMGGRAIHLPQIRGGQMMRLHGLLDSNGDLAFGTRTDLVLGEVVHRPGDRSVQLNPVGLRSRDLATALRVTAPEEGFTG